MVSPLVPQDSAVTESQSVSTSDAGAVSASVNRARCMSSRIRRQDQRSGSKLSQKGVQPVSAAAGRL